MELPHPPDHTVAIEDLVVPSILTTSPLAIAGKHENTRIATNSIQEKRASVFRNPNEVCDTRPTARGAMNPAMSVATFATTTNPASRGGVIPGKDIMYVFETGRNPASPNPATSNPALVT